ncbi:MAG: hypothetical protein J7K72_00360 [Candidatus Aenigmarchaeota archaeon]|nr:hypothetical protein [Candidatus Aenigmarchaeota archaeon]
MGTPKLKRCIDNPILMPNFERAWEAAAVFNPSVIKTGLVYTMLYRALSIIQRAPGDVVHISSIGIARSKDGVHFTNREFFFGPEYGYEAYGCEDPRVVRFEGKYYIFYTAVSDMPPKPENVKLALAITKDFKDYDKKGIVCPFNSKAGALFPRRINGKMCMLFTYHPDIRPSRLAIVCFDKIEDILDRHFWDEWAMHLKPGENLVDLRGTSEFVEVGSPPIETKYGWLVFVPDIIYKNNQFLEFRISAILLDLNNPSKVTARSKEPILYPEVGYEMMRRYNPRKIAMPTGAVVIRDRVYVYYGASDMFCCSAYMNLNELLNYLVDECKIII